MGTGFRIVLAAAGLALSFAPASGQVFSIGGGPARDVASAAPFSRGFNIQAGAEVGLPLLPVALRVEGMVNRFGTELGDDHLQVLAATANVILDLPGLGLVPYLIGGAGMYRTPLPVGAPVGARHAHWGMNAGAGLRLGMGGGGLFAEARIHATNDFETVFAPVVIGIRF